MERESGIFSGVSGFAVDEKEFGGAVAVPAGVRPGDNQRQESASDMCTEHTKSTRQVVALRSVDSSVDHP